MINIPSSHCCHRFDSPVMQMSQSSLHTMKQIKQIENIILELSMGVFYFSGLFIFAMASTKVAARQHNKNIKKKKKKKKKKKTKMKEKNAGPWKQTWHFFLPLGSFNLKRAAGGDCCSNSLNATKCSFQLAVVQQRPSRVCLRHLNRQQLNSKGYGPMGIACLFPISELDKLIYLKNLIRMGLIHLCFGSTNGLVLNDTYGLKFAVGKRACV